MLVIVGSDAGEGHGTGPQNMDWRGHWCQHLPKFVLVICN